MARPLEFIVGLPAQTRPVWAKEEIRRFQVNFSSEGQDEVKLKAPAFRTKARDGGF